MTTFVFFPSSLTACALVRAPVRGLSFFFFHSFRWILLSASMFHLFEQQISETNKAQTHNNKKHANACANMNQKKHKYLVSWSFFEKKKENEVDEFRQATKRVRTIECY